VGSLVIVVVVQNQRKNSRIKKRYSGKRNTMGTGKNRYEVRQDGAFWQVFDTLSNRKIKGDLTKNEAHRMKSQLDHRHKVRQNK
jgi:hypothetical protein